MSNNAVIEKKPEIKSIANINIALSLSVMEKAFVNGDLSGLTPGERLEYYNGLCQSLGLNPVTRPFEYIVLNEKLSLYAKKDATDQLRKIYSISIDITGRERFDDVYVVTAKAYTLDGRKDESTGVVPIGGLKGMGLANALMKAETKAKRRVTLSICGLGMLDESEIETIPDAKTIKNVPGVPNIPQKAYDNSAFSKPDPLKLGDTQIVSHANSKQPSPDDYPEEYENMQKQTLEQAHKKTTLEEWIESLPQGLDNGKTILTMRYESIQEGPSKDGQESKTYKITFPQNKDILVPKFHILNLNRDERTFLIEKAVILNQERKGNFPTNYEKWSKILPN